jgi:hypothetical protein
VAWVFAVSPGTFAWETGVTNSNARNRILASAGTGMYGPKRFVSIKHLFASVNDKAWVGKVMVMTKQENLVCVARPVAREDGDVLLYNSNKQIV